jgi:hypothetical protein
VPEQPAPEDMLAHRWAQWLLTDSGSRALSPQDDEPMDAYLDALKKNPSPTAAAEWQKLQMEATVGGD